MGRGCGGAEGRSRGAHLEEADLRARGRWAVRRGSVGARGCDGAGVQSGRGGITRSPRWIKANALGISVAVCSLMLE